MKPTPKAPRLQDCIADPQFDLLRVLELSREEAMNPKRYFNWEELRYRKPPDGLDAKAWWVGIKLHRMQARSFLPVTVRKGKAFSYSMLPWMLQQLHEIDMKAGGHLESRSPRGVSEVSRNRYLLHSIVEEAIMSSVLEGAVVTRTDAKEMLRQNRAPLNEHERMILNNYQTMKWLLEKKDEPLTPAVVREIHRLMTVGTPDDAAKAGALREESDRVRVKHSITGEVFHVPPPAVALPERLQQLCRFANGEEGDYLHPVLRAIVLHFWLAHDHPFIDGNGRTARALFYWAMLREGYWMFEYISISHEIYRHAKAYYRAYLDTEHDEGDLNYFIFNQLNVITASIDSLCRYIARKQQDFSGLEAFLRGRDNFNIRQKTLLNRLLRHRDSGISVTGYCDEFHVVRQTARTDLTALVDEGLLLCRKEGKQFLYSASPDFEKRLRTHL